MKSKKPVSPESAKTKSPPWWVTAAAALPDDQFSPKVPIHVLLGEGVDALGFVKKYYEPATDPRTGAGTRPGLKSAGTNLPEAIVGQLADLCREGQAAQSSYLLAVNRQAATGAIERGQVVLAEITATLEWLFDDGVEDEKDEQLAQVGAQHKDDPNSADALASALDDYAALAEPNRQAMHGLGGFDAAMIAEARALAQALREQPATREVLSVEAKAALAYRNRLLTLLQEKIGRVRSAARFVFRAHPNIARESGSVYERRRRAAAKRAAATAAAAAAASPGAGTA